MKQPKRMWVVMKAYGWDTIKTGTFPLRAPPEGPQRFMPVFDTKGAAVKWGGKGAVVLPVSEVRANERTNDKPDC